MSIPDSVSNLRYILLTVPREKSKRCLRFGLMFLGITALVTTAMVYIISPMKSTENKVSEKIQFQTQTLELVEEKNLNITSTPKSVQNSTNKIEFTSPSETSTIKENTTTTKQLQTTKEITTTSSKTTTTTTTTLAVGETHYGKECYTTQTINENIDYLENILTSNIQPELGQNIFFHETSCISNGLVNLNARQSCAIESAAKTNPTMKIFILFASHVGFKKNKPKPSIISTLLKYPNIHFRHVDLWSYVNGTIPEAEEFMRSESLFQSKYLFAHTADFLRILSLYRYGGSHFDLDFIVKKNLALIQPNFVCEENNNFIGNGFLNFAQNGNGHEFMKKCLLEFSTNYIPTEWGKNGPHLITKIMNQECQTKLLILCPTFRIFTAEAFFPINYGMWYLYFSQEDVETALKATEDSIAVHFWNKLSSEATVRVGSNVAYGKLAEQFCPNVYGSCGKYF